MGEDGITIKTELDTSGFKQGANELKSACNSLINGVKSGFQKISSAIGSVARRGFGLLKRNASESLKGAERSATNLIYTFKRLLPAMIGIRGAFGILQRGASSFLASNKQLQNQLTAAWTAIGNVIGPVITMLVNLISQLISYLITFLHLIGLSSMSASEAAKKTSAAAGSMQKSLMGFDEINKLQDSGGGGGAGSLVDPEMPAVLQKLGEALKLLMQDLKQTWKEAWDENGRGEKMMQSLKTLLEDIVDLAAEFVLAFDRAWMYADNGKQIFADIMEIVTNLSQSVDAIVREATEWVKTTGWLNVLVQDVRVIFDELNGISKVIKDDITPILQLHVAPILNAIAEGFHTVLEDVGGIAKGIKEGLESPQGKAMVDSLATLVEKFIGFDFSVIDLVLGTIKNINWTNISNSIKRASDSVGSMFDSLKTLFSNEKIQKALGLLIEIGSEAVSGGITIVSTAIETIANYLNGADWDGLNKFLENISGNIRIGIDTLLPIFTGKPLTTADLDRGITSVLGTALGFLLGSTLTGSVAGGIVTATIASSFILNMTALDIKDGGGRIQDLEGKIEKWLPLVAAGIGLVKGGIGGALLGLTIGTGIRLVMQNLEVGKDGQLAIDKEGLLDSIVGALGVPVGLMAGMLGMKIAGGHFAGFLVGFGLTMAVMGSIDVTDEGVKIDPVKFIGRVLGLIGFGALGAAIGAMVAGPAGILVGLTIGLAIGLFVSNVDLVTGEEKWFSGSGKHGKTIENQIQALIDQYGNETVYEAAIRAQVKAKENGIEYDLGNITKSFELAIEKELKNGASNVDTTESAEIISGKVQTSLENATANGNYSLAGSNIANGVNTAAMNADLSSGAQGVVDSFAKYLESADVSMVQETASNTFGQATKEGIAEKMKAQTSVEDIGASLGTALIKAGALTEDSAQELGTNLVSGFITGIASKIDGSGGLVETVAEAVSKSLNAGLEAYSTIHSTFIGTTLPSYVSELVTVYTNFINQFVADMNAGVSSVISAFNSMYINSMAVLSGLSNSAHRWGVDMMHNLASGIYSGASAVRNAVAAVAAMIESYLGFSEPDVGPLSNFHTFMPDMMKEMATGISQNSYLPEQAINNVAWMLANSMSTGMPEVAMGTVTPYGIGMRGEKTQEDQMSQFMDMMQQSMFQAFNAALGNQGNKMVAEVYLDGKQISDSVTKWQRRDNRAGGR